MKRDATRPHNDPATPIKKQTGGRAIKKPDSLEINSSPRCISKSRSCMGRRSAWIMEAVGDVGRGPLELTKVGQLLVWCK